MQLQHIEIDRLAVSPLNIRHARQEPDVSDILPSIRARGVLVPLLVRPNGTPDSFEIVAGRRRFFAARAVVAERGTIDPLPCAIMEPGDDAGALEASLIENLARLDPDEMSQYETFVRLTKEGKTVAGIAGTFGIPERMVMQRLALGNLLPRIRDAYRKEEIDAETIRHLTLATKAQQKEWLRLSDDPEGYAPAGWQVKQWLFGGQSIPTSAALFPLDSYPGQIVNDLFGEDGYFADSAQFWQAQEAAIAAKREALLAEGWSTVEVLEIGRHFIEWQHEKTPKKKGGKVFIAVTQRGEVTVHAGWLDRKEAGRARRAEPPEDGVEPVRAPRPAISKAMQNYLELHRHAVVRLALIADPAVAFRLLIAHTVASSGNWRVEADPQKANTDAIRDSLTGSTAQAAFAAERAEVFALLDLPEDHDDFSLRNGDAYQTAAIFARLLTMPDADVMRVAAFAMAQTLAAGSSLVEMLGTHLKVDTRQHWTPDDAFFDLARERATVNSMLAEVAGKAVADAHVAERTKTQKQIIRDSLAGTNGRTMVEGWLPGLMAFPFRSYGDGICKIGEAAERIAKLFLAG